MNILELFIIIVIFAIIFGFVEYLARYAGASPFILMCARVLIVVLILVAILQLIRGGGTLGLLR